MSDWIASFTPLLQELGPIGYVLLALATFGESFVLTGLIMPGTTILLIMGGLSLYGYYDLTLLCIAAYVGSILGNAVSYEIGRWNKSFIERRMSEQKHFVIAQKFFRKHGGKSIILSRFIGAIRAIVPFVAGAAGMERIPFYAYTFIGGLIWITSYLGFGYAFGYAWQSATSWTSAAAIAITAIVVIVIAGRWYMLRKRSKILP
jgi:membrane-associated protein